MKIKGLENKRVLRLNKRTIVHLSHQGMVKIKGGTGEGANVKVKLTNDCSLDCTATGIILTGLDLSLETVCPGNGKCAAHPVPTIDTC